jgi:polysaccharide deacetylase family protein (PEP-CTERM system associated)
MPGPDFPFPITPVRPVSNRFPCPLSDALSVDVEDYFHVEAFRDRISSESWPSYPSRVVENTRRVLDLFGQHGTKATFFVLGWVAKRFPQIVREIVAAGHEVGCHSYWHRCIWELSPKEFRADTRRARAAIEDAAGQPVVGYRAPSFSVVERSLWALEILSLEGFLYDSSVFPIHHDVYGMPRAPQSPFEWDCGEGRRLFELPPTTVRLGPWNLPAAGGGYLRILPEWYARWAFRKSRREGRGLVLYFHPWEIDPHQPRLRGRARSMFRHYFHISRMEKRLANVLASRRFVPLRDSLNEAMTAEFSAFVSGSSVPLAVASQVR